MAGGKIDFTDAKINLAGGKIDLTDAKIILGSEKIELADGKFFSADGKTILPKVKSDYPAERTWTLVEKISCRAIACD